MSWLPLPLTPSRAEGDNKKPIIALAPMADLTDQPFGLICRAVAGKDFVIFREMVSSEAVVRRNEKTLRRLEFKKSEQPVVLQIFGAAPKTMAEAAKIIADKFHPDGLDINMGCPVPKITGKNKAGAALMKYPELAAEIVSKIKEANLGIPLSIKTRLGWGKEDEILKFAPLLEQAGADLLTIHGRTKAQGYSGTANWAMIARVKKILSIPVLANGDIFSVEDAKKCLAQTQADGIMIGRGALGNPWLLAEINGGSKPLTAEIKIIVLKHARLHLKHYGERSLVTFRKHLLWYFKGWPGAREWREKLAQVKELPELEEILQKIPS